jgi:membrane fusion protein, multidrug efflux system
MKTSSRLFVLSALAGVVVSGCSRTRSPAQTDQRPSERVELAAVVEKNAPRLVSLPAEVRAADRARIAAKIAGTVQEIAVKLGQTVRAGDRLVLLTAPEFAAQAERARATLAQAERELARDRQLLKGGVTTDDAVRSAEERLRFAQAALAEAEALLAYTEIRAPFDGRIAARLADRGDLVQPGQPLLTLDLVGGREIFTHVPASHSGALSPGAELRVTAGAETSVATISEIAAAADAATRSVAVVLTLPAATPWLPGQFVTLELPDAASPRRFVPATALRSFGQLENVFVVSEGRAQLRLVQSGRAADGLVEILSGLEPGEQVITRPAATLRDGGPVEIIR